MNSFDANSSEVKLLHVAIDRKIIRDFCDLTAYPLLDMLLRELTPEERSEYKRKADELYAEMTKDQETIDRVVQAIVNQNTVDDEE